MGSKRVSWGLVGRRVTKSAGHRIEAAGFPLKGLEEQVADEEGGSSAPALHMRELNFTYCSFHFSFFVLPAIDRLLMRDYPLSLHPISPHFESHPVERTREPLGKSRECRLRRLKGALRAEAARESVHPTSCLSVSGRLGGTAEFV